MSKYVVVRLHFEGRCDTDRCRENHGNGRCYINYTRDVESIWINDTLEIHVNNVRLQEHGRCYRDIPNVIEEAIAFGMTAIAIHVFDNELPVKSGPSLV